MVSTLSAISLSNFSELSSFPVLKLSVMDAVAQVGHYCTTALEWYFLNAMLPCRSPITFITVSVHDVGLLIRTTIFGTGERREEYRYVSDEKSGRQY